MALRALLKIVAPVTIQQETLVMHGNFDEPWDDGAGLGQLTRLQTLRETAAAARKGQSDNDDPVDLSCQCSQPWQIRRAAGLVRQWVSENSTRLNELIDEAAAVGLDGVEIVQGHEIFTWLLEHEELSRSHLCDHHGSTITCRYLLEELQRVLQVPITVTCWAFYASWKA